MTLEITKQQVNEQLPIERMSLINTSPYMLQKLGLNYHVQHGQKQDIPDISDALMVAPVPRNMHPKQNGDRRQARAGAPLLSFGGTRTTRCVDESKYAQAHRFTAVVVDVDSQHVRACNVSPV
ncbi:hypothetical protein HPB50_004280 [Hyalomma asiaticum]|uniref:Uncharacterized protein n=1 Tax=Hyalomma asiaticum TaxID=266040 RepID=A0ACB7TF11_HYAAI|nr:hypothetical protein HPB50_004280 [Hyalomma asiaticum]